MEERLIPIPLFLVPMSVFTLLALYAWLHFRRLPPLETIEDVLGQDPISRRTPPPQIPSPLTSELEAIEMRSRFSDSTE